MIQGLTSFHTLISTLSQPFSSRSPPSDLCGRLKRHRACFIVKIVYVALAVLELVLKNRLVSNSQRSPCLCLLSAGIKSMDHHLPATACSLFCMLCLWWPPEQSCSKPRNLCIPIMSRRFFSKLMPSVFLFTFYFSETVLLCSPS